MPAAETARLIEKKTSASDVRNPIIDILLFYGSLLNYLESHMRGLDLSLTSERLFQNRVFQIPKDFYPLDRGFFLPLSDFLKKL